MKILYSALVEFNVEAGPKVHVLELCKNFKKLGHKVYLLSPSIESDNEIFNYIEKSIPVGFFTFTLLGYISYYVFSSLVLFFWIIRIKPDIFYEREVIGNIFSVFISRICNIKHIIEVNGFYIDDLKRNKVSKPVILFIIKIQSFIHKIVDGIIVTNSGLKKVSTDIYKVTESKIWVIDNGVDTELFIPMNKKFCQEKIKIDSKFLYIGYIGSFNPGHNLILLLHSFVYIKKKLNNVKLVLIGKGPDLYLYKSLVKYLNIERNVVFLKPVEYDKIVLYINSFDICVIFCDEIRLKTQGITSFKLLEYLACEKIVVANDRKGSVTYEKLNDILINIPDDSSSEQISEIFIKILQNSQLYEKIGEKAQKFINENCSWKKAAEQTISIFGKVLE